MSELTLIWFTSIVLAAAALLWMLGLIVARLDRERDERRRSRDRRLIQQAFLDIMNGSGDAVGRLRGVQRRSRLMAEALLEMVALVRGVERERLISALQAFGVDETFGRRLFRGSVAGRMAAAEALSIFPGERPVAALRRALTRARAAELRTGLMRSLVDVGAPPSLSQVLADISGRRASESLLYLPLIGRLVADDPSTALQAFDEGPMAGPARVMLTEALGASGDYRALEPLGRAARMPDLDLRVAAIRGLASLGHPAAEGPVLAAVSDPEWVVRAAACEAVGRIGLQTAIPLLADLLEDPVWWVRLRAGDALAGLGEPGQARLQLLAGSGGDLSRRTASMVLAERGLTAEPA